jgi:hypothetical protein
MGDYWSACSRLRAQLKLLAIKFPLEIDVLGGNAGFVTRAAVLFPAAKAKAVVSFVFDEEAFSRWPTSVSLVRCEVEVAYGNIE